MGMCVSDFVAFPLSLVSELRQGRCLSLKQVNLVYAWGGINISFRGILCSYKNSDSPKL